MLFPSGAHNKQDHKPLWMLVILFSLVLLTFGSAAQASTAAQAADITLECLFDGKGGKLQRICDHKLFTVWNCSKQDGTFCLTITAPEGKTVGGVMIHWSETPMAIDVQAQTEAGTWETVAGCDADFLVQYIAVPSLAQCRLVVRDHPEQPMRIAEIAVCTPGTPPADFQVWEKPGDKVDMLLLVAHPDDEVLWFGGMIPYYAGEQDKKILVVCATTKQLYRRLELLDSLWTCGDRAYPILFDLPDYVGSKGVEGLLEDWGRDELVQNYTELFRRYKPDVVMLHDMKGETGHTAHKAMNYLGRMCAQLAADPTQYPESAAAYGVWDTPKIYIHLYEENTIYMDWNTPLTAFGGMTAQDVARAGFAKQVSQAVNHKLKDGGEYDNSCFGLYYTLVGPDVAKNDLFENIP